ncbi:MAG TPA: alkaline phosphatase family protein [Vicinamibacteria bacterium]|nr:alkaline phosphatase family protein [Vicinamibacteria bacterium]
MQRARLVLFCWLCGVLTLSARPRVILVSFDGAGHVVTTRLAREGKLPNFTRIMEKGAWSDGMVTSFPTKTAAAHAMLFTGHYGHTNGITGNEVLELPAREHTRLETTSGYFSGPLRVEPLWLMAAKAGLETFVFHATQAYPFPEGPNDPHLFIAHGYTDAQADAESISAERVGLPTTDWVVPEAGGDEAREMSFSVGDSVLHGLFYDDPFDPSYGCDTLGIVRDKSDASFAARVKAGEGEPFSSPVRVTAAGRDLWFSMRLFELAPDASTFVLYRSGAAELAVSNGSFPGHGLPVLEVFAGNAGSRVYERGGLGVPLFQGGDGEAERRLMETEAHLQEQLISQARLALEEDYDLVVLYSPVTDEIGHALMGYLSPDLDGYDPRVAERLWPVLIEAYGLQDRFLGVLLDAAERDGAHVIVVSDHGMAPIDRLVHLNIALEQAGLVALDAGRRIDLSRTRALALPLSDTSIAVNLVDRRSGIVPLDEKDSVIEEARRALTALVDPDSGDRIVLEIYEPSTRGLLQPGGDGTGDLFVELAPRYYPSTSTERALVVERVAPSGQHIFLPTRREMLAIFGIIGPRVRPGLNVGRARGIDVTPTVLDLLGTSPGDWLPGRSLVPRQGLLQYGR